MDKPLKPNYQELIFNDKDYEDVFSESFFYNPETFDEEELGHLFLVGKIKSKVERRQGPVFLLNYIASKLSQNYYTYINYKIKDALSNSLEIVNRLIKELYYKKEIDWLQDMFLLAGVIYKDKIYFSILNKGAIFLWRDNKIQDLITQEPSSDKTDTYFFDRIFKADVNPNDRILVVTHLEHAVAWRVDYFHHPDIFKQEAIGSGNKSFAVLLIFFGKTGEDKTVIHPVEKIAKEDNRRLISKTAASQLKIKSLLVYAAKFLTRLRSIKVASNLKINFRLQIRKLIASIIIVGILLVMGLVLFEVQKSRSIKHDLEKAKGYLEAFYSFDYKDNLERRRFLNEARVIFEKYSYLAETTTDLQRVQFLLKNLDIIQILPRINIINLDKLGFEPSKMIVQGRALLLTDGAQIGTVDLLREEVGDSGVLFNQKLDPRLIQLQNDKIYGLMPQSKKIFTYDLKIKSINEAYIDVPDAETIAMQLYRDFVYTLNQDGLIYKYPRLNLNKRDAWFKKVPSFQTPLNFGIDGKIYVMDSGKVYRFLKGELELENQLNDNKIKNFWLSPEKFDFFIVWTDSYVYLVSKNDLKIKNVIISPKFNKIKDVAVDDNNTFYFLQDKEVIAGFLE